MPVQHAFLNDYSLLICSKAKNSRMDDVDGVVKIVNFFREMKEINREFFCDIQLDESDRVKNIQAAEGPIRTLVTA